MHLQQKEFILDKNGKTITIGNKTHVIKQLSAGEIAVLSDNVFDRLEDLRDERKELEPENEKHILKSMMYYVIGSITLVLSVISGAPFYVISAATNVQGIYHTMKLIKNNRKVNPKIKNYRRMKIILLSEYMRRIKKGDEDLTFANTIMNEVADKHDRRKQERMMKQQEIAETEM